MPRIGPPFWWSRRRLSSRTSSPVSRGSSAAPSPRRRGVAGVLAHVSGGDHRLEGQVLVSFVESKGGQRCWRRAAGPCSRGRSWPSSSTTSSSSCAWPCGACRYTTRTRRRRRRCRSWPRAYCGMGWLAVENLDDEGSGGLLLMKPVELLPEPTYRRFLRSLLGFGKNVCLTGLGFGQEVGGLGGAWEWPRPRRAGGEGGQREPQHARLLAASERAVGERPGLAGAHPRGLQPGRAGGDGGHVAGGASSTCCARPPTTRRSSGPPSWGATPSARWPAGRRILGSAEPTMYASLASCACAQCLTQGSVFDYLARQAAAPRHPSVGRGGDGGGAGWVRRRGQADHKVLDPNRWKRLKATLSLEKTTKRLLKTLAEEAAAKEARAAAARQARAAAEAGGGGGGGGAAGGGGRGGRGA